jgi:hypothetical protein
MSPDLRSVRMVMSLIFNSEFAVGPASNRLAEIFSLYRYLSSPQQPIAGDAEFYSEIRIRQCKNTFIVVELLVWLVHTLPTQVIVNAPIGKNHVRGVRFKPQIAFRERIKIRRIEFE